MLSWALKERDLSGEEVISQKPWGFMGWQGTWFVGVGGWERKGGARRGNGVYRRAWVRKRSKDYKYFVCDYVLYLEVGQLIFDEWINFLNPNIVLYPFWTSASTLNWSRDTCTQWGLVTPIACGWCCSCPSYSPLDVFIEYTLPTVSGN